MKSSNAVLLTLAAGAVLSIAVARQPLAVPGISLDADGVFKIAAENNTHLFGGAVDPQMVTAIAFIESNFNPTAVRPELALNDASIGLMQTLISTAEWLFDDMGYNFRGIRPSFGALFDHEVSLYYGMAYLHYLATRHPSTRGKGEEVTVRGYNGGPGGAFKPYTDGYWSKYQAAKLKLFGEG